MKINAYLMGEKFSGVTAVSIIDWEKEELLWFARYSKYGTTYEKYVDMLLDAWLAMYRCAEVEDYDAEDEGVRDGLPIYRDMLSYDPATDTWEAFPGFRRFGQSEEILDALMLIGLLPPDEEHEGRTGGVAYALAHKIIHEIVKRDVAT